jgi:FtsZ-binding cell division protein ZapB
LEQLELRTYQASDTIATMKREAKEEREKITKRQKELEVLIEVI